MITNQEQFNKALKAALTNCIEYISDKMLQCLQEHIMEDVYYYDTPNTWYNNGSGNPTYEFLNAFEFEGVQQKAKEVSNTLFYNWMEMSSPSSSNKFLHGNYEEGIDRRASLAEILNVNSSSPAGSFDLRDKQRQPYWDNAIEEMNRKFGIWAKEAYNKYLK